MKKIILLPLLLFTAILGFAQKVIHDANADVRPVSDYHSIVVSGGIDLYVSYGDETVVVSAKEVTHRNRIRTEVEKGVLKIWYEWKDSKGFNISSGKGLKAYVSYKTLKLLSASGGSNVKVDGTIKSDDLVLRVSGGSDFNGRVEVRNLNVNQSGGSDINISGTAVNANIISSGGSDFNGYNMVLENCNAVASGGSDVRITVNKDLKVVASGGSDISYKGSATVVESNKSGSSSIKKI